MSYSQIFIWVILEMALLFGIVFSISMASNKNALWKYLGGVLLSSILLSASSFFQTNEPVSTSLNIVIAFVVIKIITGFKLDKIVVLYSFSLSIMYAFQMLSVTALSIIIPMFDKSFIHGVYSSVLSIILIMLVLKFLPIRSAFEKVINGNRWVRIAVINAFIVYYLLVMLWYMNFSGFLESIISVTLIISVLLAIDILLIKEVFEKQIIKQKMEMYDTYLPIVEEMIEEIRNKQHDYHNHLQALEGIDLIDDYKRELEMNNPWQKLLPIDNKLLMAFLFSKYTLAQKKNIHINYKIKNHLLVTKYTDYELIEVLGILMDNALEAVLRYEKEDFDVLIDYVDNKTVVEVSNESPYIDAKAIGQMFERKYSSKESDDHGIGLPKLEKVLKKNNDTIVVHYDITWGKIVFRVGLS